MDIITNIKNQIAIGRKRMFEFSKRGNIEKVTAFVIYLIEREERLKQLSGNNLVNS